MEATDPTTNLGEELKRLRQERGVSIPQLAKLTGINRSTLQRIEGGQTTQAYTATLNALARALSVEPEVLYDAYWQDQKTPLPSAGTYFRSKYKLTPDQIARLEDSLKEFEGESKPNQERRSP